MIHFSTFLRQDRQREYYCTELCMIFKKTFNHYFSPDNVESMFNNTNM